MSAGAEAGIPLAENIVALRLLPPEPVCEDQLALIRIARELLRLACEGSLHSLAVVYTRNDDNRVTRDWQTCDGALADIISAVGILQYELISSEE